MNDFTKEELEHITTLFKFVEVAYPDYKLNENLWVKVESMIDNYCEHEPDGIRHTVVSGGDRVERIYKCRKCGKLERVIEC